MHNASLWSLHIRMSMWMYNTKCWMWCVFVKKLYRNLWFHTAAAGMRCTRIQQKCRTLWLHCLLTFAVAPEPHMAWPSRPAEQVLSIRPHQLNATQWDKPRVYKRRPLGKVQRWHHVPKIIWLSMRFGCCENYNRMIGNHIIWINKKRGKQVLPDVELTFQL